MSKLAPYLSKDFIETTEGLCFAVVQNGVENCGAEEKLLCFLRYIKKTSQSTFSLFESIRVFFKYNPKQNRLWRKVTTEQANTFLQAYHPEYLHYSTILDAQLHAVATGRIIKHHHPKQRLQQIFLSQQRDKVEQDLFDLCQLFQQNGLELSQIGVTGSILIGVQQPSSDIDLVFYDREHFHKARAITAELISNQLGDLGNKDWQEAYARRSCTLSLQEYIWHERRKFNKGLINGRKFDLNFVDSQTQSEPINYQKCGEINVQCKIIEDRYGFDYPAKFVIDHETINTVVCFIATYTGQAFVGETVEVSGFLEQAEDGSKRIVVGSSREAPGEYIKVIQCPN
ncbi:hypothetical protein [Methyloglobulus sp.]|uniref:hypothetical protein n=1 Tax=Methyloglobulus sp. TaxID=2518622 RepID=UPI0032B71BD2